MYKIADASLKEKLALAIKDHVNESAEFQSTTWEKEDIIKESTTSKTTPLV